MDLTGKKILYIESNGDVYTLTIEGIDESIGICLVDELGEPDFVLRGPLDPLVRGSNLRFDEKDVAIFKECENMLKSGYLSCFQLNNKIKELGLKNYIGGTNTTCPFSM